MFAAIFNGVAAGLGEGASATGEGLSIGDGLGDAVGAVGVGAVGVGEFCAVGGGVVQLAINRDSTIAPVPVRIIVPWFIRILKVITTFLTIFSLSMSNPFIHINVINRKCGDLIW